MQDSIVNYTNLMKLFLREAKKLIAVLPKGSIRETNAALKRFLETESLRRWYNALHVRLLKITEFESLLNKISSRLQFKGLNKKGLNNDEVKNLRYELLSLFLDCCGKYSEAEPYADTSADYRIRLYKLRRRPEAPVGQWQSLDD